MPLLTSPTAQPSNTNPPGLVRRRVWSAPDVKSHSLVVLTLPRLYLTPMTGIQKPELIAAIEQGADVDTILGPLATVVHLHAVRRVRLDLLTNTLHIEYTVSGTGTTRVAVTFATAEVADAVFSKLWRRLGAEFQLKPLQSGPMAVTRGPIIAILTVLLIAGLSAIGLNALRDIAASRQWAYAEMLPDWRWICGLAGAVAALLTIWLYRRLTSPPERLDLVRGEPPPGSSLMFPNTHSTPRNASV